MNCPGTIKVILSEQVRNYREMLDVLQREKVCLLNLNVEQVEALAREKDIVTLKLRLLEEERLRLMRGFAAEQGIAGEITLQGLASLCGDKDLDEVRQQMLSLLQGIMELNGFNRIITERSLLHAQGALSVLGMHNPAVSRSRDAASISKQI